MWELEKVILAITYRKELGPEKQAIIQKWERPSTSKKPSIDIQVAS